MYGGQITLSVLDGKLWWLFVRVCMWLGGGGGGVGWQIMSLSILTASKFLQNES